MDGERRSVRPRLVQPVVLREGSVLLLCASTGVLASATMPAVMIEVGNLNNPLSAQAMLDIAFQAKLSTAIATAIEHFAAARQAEAHLCCRHPGLRLPSRFSARACERKPSATSDR